jgi:hypothetical protein
VRSFIFWGSIVQIFRPGKLVDGKSDTKPACIGGGALRDCFIDRDPDDCAVLETDGVLNTILSPGERPVTAQQMNVPVDDTGYPSILISDGRIMADNLRRMGRDGNWLKAELKRQGVSEPGQVYLLTLNAAGQVYFAAKEAGK